MNKRLIILLCIALLTLIIIIMSIIGVNLNKNDNENSSEQITYVLKKHNNTIAIFIDGQATPYRILDVAYNNLPFEDKEELVKGIYSNSLAEIMKQAEDYDG